MTRRPTVTLVLALAVLAGCSAIGGEATPTTGRPAVTPAPVADDSGDAPDRSAADAAPGIGPNGSVDLRAVERAHRTRVANRSFEFVIAGNVTSDGGIRGYRYSAAVANESTYRVRFDAGGSTVERYADGSREFQRVYNRTSGEATVTTAGAVDRAVYYTRTLLAYFDDDAERVDSVTRDGTTYTRLYFERQPGDSILSDAGNVTSYRATAYVAPDGLIRTVVVNYRYEGYGDEGEYALRFETRDVGNTTVERPDWVPNATAGETAAPG